MEVCRFMSLIEFNDYRTGKVLKNHTNWREEGSHTDSVGFCFFPANAFDETPEERLRYLRGVIKPVKNHVCAIFETEEKMKLSKSKYRDPDFDDYRYGSIAYMYRDEYSIEKYSANTFHLVNYGSLDYVDGKILWGELRPVTPRDIFIESNMTQLMMLMKALS